MRHILLSASFAAALALCAAGPAFAADNTVSSLRTTDNLSAEQKAQLDAWATRQLNQIRGGLPEDIAAAREVLISELRIPGSSAAYKTALGNVVSAPAGDLLRSQKDHVRLNAAIVLAHVNDPDALLALTPAIQDPSAGVRLWACRAARMIIEPASSERITVSAAREAALIKSITAQMAKEADAAVYREQVELLITLGSPKAYETLLAALDARLKAHAADPELAYEIELRALNALYQKFLQTDEKGPILMSLLAVAYRCEKLALAQMAAKADNKHLADDNKAVILAADKMIRDQYTRLNQGKPIPQPLSQIVPFPVKWKDATPVVQQWQALLKDKPFLIPADKLK